MPAMRVKYEQELIEEVKNLPEEYFPYLLQIVHLFKESVTFNTANESFMQGWKEVKGGKTRPIAELWEKIDAE